MTTKFRRPMLVLGTTILIMQAVFMPIGMVYAETTMDTEEQEQVERPPMKNYLEEEQASDPRFFFARSRVQGAIEEPLKVTFYSDLEVTKVRITLPKEAKIIKEQLQSGVSIAQEKQSNQWMVHAERAQQTFVLPLVFESAGNYEVSIDKETTTIEVSEKEESSPKEQSEVDPNYVTEHNLEKQENSDAQFLDASPRSWNIDDFPLLISRGDQLLRPELIPDNYYYVAAANSSLPANVGWMRASDRRPVSGRLTSISHIFPDIIQDSTGANLDLFFDVSQSIDIDTLNTPGRLWGAVGMNTFPGFTADISLKNSDEVLLEAPIYFYQSNNIAYTIHIKKDDLIGMTLPNAINTLSVRESVDTYSFTTTASGSGSIGWILRNGAQFRTTSRNGMGISMFVNRSTNSIVKNLAFEILPIEGGSAGSNKTFVFQGEKVDIRASSNPGYQFKRWEIVSGSGGMIEDVEEKNTKFTMGSSDTVLRAIFEENKDENKYEVLLEANPINGGTPEVELGHLSQGEKTKILANPNQAYDFVRWEILNGEGSTIDDPLNAVTTVTMGNEDTTIRAVYEPKVVPPMDPLAPEVEVDPENPPKLPDEQGLLSIDFISSFDFGSQDISVHDQIYYAQPQRLLNEDGTVNESEERPNYVQISDRRREEERNGWSLAVTQREQFQGETKQQMTGAQLRIANQQLVSVNGEEEPSLQLLNPLTLIPGNKRTLLRAEESEGKGTWIYRFGNSETAAQSVSLTVPKGANPEAISYSSTLIWELSAVPGN